MQFTPSEFLSFAHTAQADTWETKTGKAFKYRVELSGIRLLPSTGMERVISNSEIVRFCELFNSTGSFRTSDYQELFNKSYLLPIAANFDLSRTDFAFAEELSISGAVVEGALKQVTINAYERSPIARKRCIESHGTTCCVCGFNFEEMYGEFAAGYIHVHHLSPVAEMGGKTEVDPEQDMRPVCPNCHSVIHLRGGCLSIEEAKQLLKNPT